MAVGENIVSVYCGAADKDSFEEIATVSQTPTHHPEYDMKTKQYHCLFQKVRYCRENQISYESLPKVWKEIQTNFPEDWLCSMEILEILNQDLMYKETVQEIRICLEMKASAEPSLTKLINDGFYLIKNPINQLA
jgi:phenylalanine-4-hydroxylase